MRRREFVAGLGAAVAWPAVAQQPKMPVIAFFRSTTPFENLVLAFAQGLKETGFVEGQNVTIDYRYANNQMDRLPGMVADLLGRPPAAIVGDTIAMVAVKAGTATVPIVFATGGDPVALGLVSSLNRPGGNVTGVVFFATLLGTKRLELLRQLVPKATTIAVFANPNSANTEAERNEIRAAAQTLHQQLVVLDVNSDRDIETAFATIVARGAGALLVGSGTFLNSNRERIVALAARHRVPAIYSQREAAVAGGLMSYGTSLTDAYRQAGVYVGRILKGEKPAELPVLRSTKFELVINLKTAKTLGLDPPSTLLALADEVIE
jgi:putative tryptophan/tyrosine transport system substrate-binding protein